MKNLILVLVVGFAAHTQALGEWIPNYTILKDTLNKEVPQGKCLVKGTIYDYGGSPITSGIVGTVDFTKQTKVNLDGTYEILLDDTDSDIFFFAHSYSESVLYGYDFISQHEVTINFLASTDMGVIEMEKPVIYCYSDEPISVNLALDFKSELTFSYPSYPENGWDIELDKNGITSDGAHYPYLFWEGETEHLAYHLNSENQFEGYLIKTDTVVDFLKNTLTAYGLNSTEKTDFITYWGPRMVAKKYALVQFMVGEEYDANVAGLKAAPKPDVQLRIFMSFTGMDIPLVEQEVITPSVTSVERSGFTLVEWGGAEVPYRIESAVN